MLQTFPSMGEMLVMSIAVVIPILVLGLAAWLIIRAVMTRSSGSAASAEEMLRRRYASGEIDTDEYQRRLEVLRLPG
jgi:uncharacterized membrane protein